MTHGVDITELTGYRDCLMAVEPRPITSERQAEGYRALIDQLTDLPVLSPGQKEFVGLLGQLVYDWEREHDDPITATPQEIVSMLLEENGLPQSALVGPVFANRHHVSEFLAGRRSLSYARVGKLATFFHVSPALFYSAQGLR